MHKVAKTPFYIHAMIKRNNFGHLFANGNKEPQDFFITSVINKKIILYPLL